MNQKPALAQQVTVFKKAVKKARLFNDEDRSTRDQVVKRTRSGGVCVNDTIVHITGRDLPFGGLGESGMGSYHGHAGFRAFTHERSVMDRKSSPDPKLRYPPAKIPLARMRRLMRWFG